MLHSSRALSHTASIFCKKRQKLQFLGVWRTFLGVDPFSGRGKIDFFASGKIEAVWLRGPPRTHFGPPDGVPPPGDPPWDPPGDPPWTPPGTPPGAFPAGSQGHFEWLPPYWGLFSNGTSLIGAILNRSRLIEAICNGASLTVPFTNRGRVA